jgi:hypothetical protein
MSRSKLSRRRFLALISAGASAAAGGAIAATDPAPRRTAKKPKAAKPAAPLYTQPPAPSEEVARGIAQQKEWLAASLKTIRTFDLPPGSEQGFAFTPLKQPRKS